MLAHLLESRPRRSRRPATFALSVATHAAAIAVVLTGTSVAGPAPAPDETTIPQLLAPPAPRAPAPAPRGGTTATGPASPGPRMNLTTIEIEPGIPPVDLNAPPTPDDFAPGAGGVGEALGTFHGASETIGDGILTLDQVERPVLALPGAVPRYPEPLRAALRDPLSDHGGVSHHFERFCVGTRGRSE